MTYENPNYGGPFLCVSIGNSALDGEPPKYQWEIKMSAPDHQGKGKLGYMASGFLADLECSPLEFGIQVHDREQSVWTTMPLSHRKDIREHMKLLIKVAIETMKSCGHV